MRFHPGIMNYVLFSAKFEWKSLTVNLLTKYFSVLPQNENIPHQTGDFVLFSAAVNRKRPLCKNDKRSGRNMWRARVWVGVDSSSTRGALWSSSKKKSSSWSRSRFEKRWMIPNSYGGIFPTKSHSCSAKALSSNKSSNPSTGRADDDFDAISLNFFLFSINVGNSCLLIFNLLDNKLIDFIVSGNRASITWSLTCSCPKKFVPFLDRAVI